MTIDNDDALLDALSRGDASPPGDDVAMLMAAWHAEIADIAPATLRPARPAPSPHASRRVPRPRPGAGGSSRGGGGAGDRAGPGARRPRRFPRPLVVVLATALAAFGGLAGASATAEPGSALWPLAQLVWSERAESKVAEAQARELLRQAREALAQNRSQDAVQLVVRAAVAIDRIIDPAVRQQLKQEAIDLLGEIGTAAAAPGSAKPEQPPAQQSPAQQTPAQQSVPPPPAGTPTPGRTGLLPPLLPSLLPSILPSWLPSLPILR